MSVSALMREQAEAWGLELTPEAFGAFDLYASRLKEANRTKNLTAVDDDEGIARRHFLDSLRPLVLGWLQPQARLVDVGTGAGFPGLPLAIARPDIRVTLADSLGKRVDFLRRMTEELGLEGQVELLWIRAEELGRDAKRREAYDLACARAVAALPTLAEYLLPLVRQGGAMLAWKGPGLAEELARAQRALDLLGGGRRMLDHYGLGGQQLTLARIEKSRPTPEAYPRKNGKPSRQPL